MRCVRRAVARRDWRPGRSAVAAASGPARRGAWHRRDVRSDAAPGLGVVSSRGRVRCVRRAARARPGRASCACRRPLADGEWNPAPGISRPPPPPPGRRPGETGTGDLRLPPPPGRRGVEPGTGDVRLPPPPGRRGVEPGTGEVRPPARAGGAATGDVRVTPPPGRRAGDSGAGDLREPPPGRRPGETGTGELRPPGGRSAVPPARRRFSAPDGRGDDVPPTGNAPAIPPAPPVGRPAVDGRRHRPTGTARPTGRLRGQPLRPRDHRASRTARRLDPPRAVRPVAGLRRTDLGWPPRHAAARTAARRPVHRLRRGARAGRATPPRPTPARHGDTATRPGPPRPRRPRNRPRHPARRARRHAARHHPGRAGAHRPRRHAATGHRAVSAADGAGTPRPAAAGPHPCRPRHEPAARRCAARARVPHARRPAGRRHGAAPGAWWPCRRPTAARHDRSDPDRTGSPRAGRPDGSRQSDGSGQPDRAGQPRRTRFAGAAGRVPPPGRPPVPPPGAPTHAGPPPERAVARAVAPNAIPPGQPPPPVAPVRASAAAPVRPAASREAVDGTSGVPPLDRGRSLSASLTAGGTEIRRQMRDKRFLRVAAMVGVILVVLGALPLYLRHPGGRPRPGLRLARLARGEPWAAQQVTDRIDGSRLVHRRVPVPGADRPLGEGRRGDRAGVRDGARRGRLAGVGTGRGCPEQPVPGQYSCWRRDEFTLDLWVRAAGLPGPEPAAVGGALRAGRARCRRLHRARTSRSRCATRSATRAPGRSPASTRRWWVRHPTPSSPRIRCPEPTPRLREAVVRYCR